MSFIPLQAFGPVTFSSGQLFKKVDGPKRTNYVQEHEIPGREGGIVEYVGSKQPTYKIQGFLAPNPDQFGGVAVAILSGGAYYGTGADGGMMYLQGLRGSGAQLLRLESTWSNFSGYPRLYENDFFYCASMTFALEAGRGYPYYPYTIDLMRASYSTYGNSSGTSTFTDDVAPAALSGAFYSGYIRGWFLLSGLPLGGRVMGLGFYAQSVAYGGNARLAVYSGSAAGSTLVVQTASQPVTSGWNYFPLNPSFTAQSGSNAYFLAFMSDMFNIGSSAGFALAYSDSNPAGSYSVYSGAVYANGFPATLGSASGYTSISGYALDITVVTT